MCHAQPPEFVASTKVVGGAVGESSTDPVFEDAAAAAVDNHLVLYWCTLLHVAAGGGLYCFQTCFAF
jgi:hypothetical protein